MQSLEVWKDIPGYEGWYQVSNMGRVRSVDRVIEQVSSHGGMIIRHVKGHAITPTDNGNGYKIVGLRKNQDRKNFYVHRLVANAFIANADKKPVINHLDYDKSNNSFLNLEWTTQLENTRYSIPRMCKSRPHLKPKSTGVKYVTIRNGRYRLNIQHGGVRVDKTYATLEEAVAAKGVLIGDKEYYAGC